MSILVGSTLKNVLGKACWTGMDIDGQCWPGHFLLGALILVCVVEVLESPRNRTSLSRWWRIVSGLSPSMRLLERLWCCKDGSMLLRCSKCNRLIGSSSLLLLTSHSLAPHCSPECGFIPPIILSWGGAWVLLGLDEWEGPEGFTCNVTSLIHMVSYSAFNMFQLLTPSSRVHPASQIASFPGPLSWREETSSEGLVKFRK